MCAAEHGHLDIVKYLLAQPDCDSTKVDVVSCHSIVNNLISLLTIDSSGWKYSFENLSGSWLP